MRIDGAHFRPKQFMQLCDSDWSGIGRVGTRLVSLVRALMVPKSNRDRLVQALPWSGISDRFGVAPQLELNIK